MRMTRSNSTGAFTERASREYWRRYSDADVFYLAVNPPESAPRMVEASANLGLPSPTGGLRSRPTASTRSAYYVDAARR
jgi:hypothetical protein